MAFGKDTKRYNLGDVVRIRSVPPADRFLHSPVWVHDMDRYCGRLARIRCISDIKEDRYQVVLLGDISAEPPNYWWCSAYFEDRVWSEENESFPAASQDTICGLFAGSAQ